MPVVCEFILVSLFPSEQVLVTSTAQKCELDAGVSPPVEAPVPPPGTGGLVRLPPPPSSSPNPIYPWRPGCAAFTPPASALPPPSPTSRASSSRAAATMKATAAFHSLTGIVSRGCSPHALLAALPALTKIFMRNNPPQTTAIISRVFSAHTYPILNVFRCVQMCSDVFRCVQMCSDVLLCCCVVLVTSRGGYYGPLGGTGYGKSSLGKAQMSPPTPASLQTEYSMYNWRIQHEDHIEHFRGILVGIRRLGCCLVGPGSRICICFLLSKRSRPAVFIITIIASSSLSRKASRLSPWPSPNRSS
ncbi:hypothetical protein C8Q69DRAFT_29562 [Paecilomyces variotii]|uniref:Uncharacterized protein n=1 Tax=Byssochlamys spectabilis TaxID=264951 RepID=A0A443I654_BYSSP|nr:hypothetical protein C8Q69DRAFT_29562 [Paecilomyces variotii]RWQ99568.1 hypothetical protein C8Q69DRAFT_29562 [Paecilomyces variotii]